jgi:hypothetical protein
MGVDAELSMKIEISHEDQFLSFSLIQNHYNGSNVLNKKDLFLCDRICDLYAAKQAIPIELYNEFLTIINNNR